MIVPYSSLQDFKSLQGTSKHEIQLPAGKKTFEDLHSIAGTSNYIIFDTFLYKISQENNSAMVVPMHINVQVSPAFS